MNYVKPAGGFMFTGLAIYTTYKPRPVSDPARVTSPSQVPAE